MLLILAPEADEVAAEFEDFSRARGTSVVRASDSITLVTQLSRSGTPSVEVRAGSDTIHGIFNRGLAVHDESHFANLEGLAAWWCALAHFSGPVINRPSRSGFVPDLDILSLMKSVRGLQLAPMRIANSAPSFQHGTINAHSVTNGRFLGRDFAVPSQEIALFTEFDPNCTLNLVVCGNTSFATKPEAGLSLEQSEILWALESEMRSRAATFSAAVLQIRGASIEVIHATPLPSKSYFNGADGLAYEAAWSYLCGT